MQHNTIGIKFKDYLRITYYAGYMPAKNRLKIYIENGYYHIYNRGVEKRLVFLDTQDYAVFISYLSDYLSFKDEIALRKELGEDNISSKEKDKILKSLLLKNFYGKITLLAFCLMPNHIHLELKQTEPNTIALFMKSLCTRYTMYFNRKYNRVGALWQDAYKAVILESNEQILYLSKYIHKQALGTQGQSLRSYNNNQNQPSSYPEYLGLRKTEWIHPEEILSYFSKNNSKLSYHNFVEDQDDLSVIDKLILED